MRRVALVLAIGSIAALGLAIPAYADSRTCTGTIGAITIDGDVNVPQGATCRLNGTRVDGNVKVNNNARLFATDVFVGGSVQSDGQRRTEVTGGSKVIGDVQIEQGKSGLVRGSAVNGTISVKQNTGPQVIAGNTVDSDVQVFTNTGGVRISNNVIDGNLQCKSNNPPPTGGGNQVQGEKEDQCASL